MFETLGTTNGLGETALERVFGKKPSIEPRGEPRYAFGKTANPPKRRTAKLPVKKRTGGVRPPRLPVRPVVGIMTDPPRFFQPSWNPSDDAPPPAPPINPQSGAPTAAQMWAGVASQALGIFGNRRSQPQYEPYDDGADVQISARGRVPDDRVGANAKIGLDPDGNLDVGGGVSLSPMVLIGGTLLVFVFMSGGKGRR